MMKRLFHWPMALLIAFAAACTPGKKLQQSIPPFLQDSALARAHVGVAVYDPGTQKFLYDYQGEKLFAPASNTKLFSLYAGLKYLGDSLPGIRYRETDTAVYVLPLGDPSLLHPDYNSQPVIDLLKKIHKPVYLIDSNWKEKPLGAGWAWDDYNEDYQIERSALPVYGNFIRWTQQMPDQQGAAGDMSGPSVFPSPWVDWPVHFSPDSGSFLVQRDLGENKFLIRQGTEHIARQDVPFVTHGLQSAAILLADTLGLPVKLMEGKLPAPVAASPVRQTKTLPADSLYRPMMFRSDNFFAEQVLLMASQQKLGEMSDEGMVDTLLKTDLHGLPQQPTWVDGSGLSRFNLFSPKDFVWLLDKMQNEFGLNRMKGILPTGGQGTLRSYYKNAAGYIYAKTGSLSDVIALSGYLITKKNKLLLFSILINNYPGSGVFARRAMQSFLLQVRENN